MNKQALRKQYIVSRKEVPEFEKRDKSLKIREALFSLPEYHEAEIIFSYMSTADEVDTRGIITGALAMGKRVAVPTTVNKYSGLFFIEIFSLDNLVHGVLGIDAPKEGAIIRPDEKSLMLVPGVAFNRGKYRLGFGGGYYDRYLSTAKTLKNTGLFFSVQECVDLIIEPHDFKLDMIITENEILK